MPDADYFCRVTYYTPAGHRRTTSIRTLAPNPHQAAALAKRRLVRDKRRAVARIDDVEAIQICP
jgi:hypothetical protein